jgi:type IV secretory pathway VirB3-like protein
MKEKLIGMTRYLPGLILMFLGLVIVAFPMLLVAFVSALLVMGGILAVAIAHRTKHLEDDIAFMFASEPLDRSFWGRAKRVFCRRRWY